MNSNGLLLGFTSGNQTWHHGKLGTHRAFCKMERFMAGKLPLGSDRNWLVGQGHPSEKYESIGMMDIPNILGQIKNGHQTTNQMMTKRT